MGYYYQMPGYHQQTPPQHHGSMTMHGQQMKNNPYMNTMQHQGHHPVQPQLSGEVVNQRTELLERVKDEIRNSLVDIEGKE
jgi:hypothetical protein